MSFPTRPADLRFSRALVFLEKVCFPYGNGDTLTPAPNEVSLTIQPDEMVGIAGLNGLGKSTLLFVFQNSQATVKPSLSLSTQTKTASQYIPEPGMDDVSVRQWQS